MKAGIVFYDGNCPFCFFWVDWLLKKDRKKQLEFAPLQGETAKKMGVHTDEPHTLIFVRSDSTQFSLASAVLEILKTLGRVWFFLYYLVAWIPRGFLDRIYLHIAKNRSRYKLIKRNLPEDKRILP